MAAPRSNSALTSPVKIAMGIVIAAAVVAGGWCLRRDTNAALIVCGGACLVALLLFGYAKALGSVRQRRARPMAQAIINNSGASPNSISQPGRRAALDDLRKKFQVGVSKFSAAGKDLYSLPWYLVVGEPGGGKTEAIRHCNVGFPPGLQDYTQGAGGTLNMNWWFTNHAILLDTAGRMLFEEAPPGTTSEWDEFLQLLVKSRADCPVNGMLLVLPADSLITDSADKIEQKAARIAQQLDHIQRALRVRFPVFIVITKCDLINGFREFFDGLTDPQLQHQMLGWSNPQPLDEPFRPADVDRHLQSIRERLISRGQVLLIDPINTDDPSASRLDQVDALYSFPDSFVKIAPRLRRYLEMIFVVGEWSPDPLFLRGIYFTSSMREGSALDADLAEALKVPVESLKGDGRSWERERAYFLRDVFMAKAFRERGLVTRAANTRRLQRQRRALLVGTCVLAVLSLGLLTWTGTRQMQNGIGEQTEYWMSVGANWHDRRPQWSIVRSGGQPDSQGMVGSSGTGWHYAGFENLSLGDNAATIGQFFSDRAHYAGSSIDIPWIFRPQAMIRGNLNQKRETAYRTLFESSVLGPVVDAVRAKLVGDDPASFSPYAGPAIGELIRIESLAGGSAPPPRRASVITDADPQTPLDLDPLMRFLLSDEDYARFKIEHRSGLQDVLQWAYGTGSSIHDFPPQILQAQSDVAVTALKKAVKNFNDAWALRISGQDPVLAQVKAVQEPLRRFQTAEDQLQRSFATDLTADSASSGALPLAKWSEILNGAGTAAAAADQAIQRIENQTPTGWSLSNLYEIELDRDVEAALRSHEELMGQLPRDPGALPELKDIRDSLSEAATKIPQFRAESLSPEVQAYLSRFDRFYLAPARGVDGKDYRGYQVRAQIYDGILQLLKIAGPPNGDPSAAASFASLKSTFDRVDAQTTVMNQRLSVITPGNLSGDDQLSELCRQSTNVTGAIALRLKFAAVSTAMRNAPADEPGFAQLVRSAAPASPAKLPSVPLTQATGQEADPQFDPFAAKTVLGEVFSLGQFLQNDVPAGDHGDTDAIAEKFRNLQAAARQYVDAYCHYWAEQVPGLLEAKLTAWEQFFGAEGKPLAWKPSDFNVPLKALGGQCADALGAMEEAAPLWKQDLQVSAAREQLENATRQADGPLFETACQKILDDWRKLNPDTHFDPMTARNALLDQTPQAWRDQFILSDQEGPLASKFWSSLDAELLRVLAMQAQSSIAATASQSLQNLRSLNRFPLAKPRTGDTPLTTPDISAASVALATLQKVMRPHSSAAFAGATLRQGAAVGVPAIDASISQLLGVDLDQAESQWLLQLSRLIAALPTDKPLACTISVAGGKEREMLATADPPDWYSVVFGQGTGAGGEVQLLPMPDSTQKLGSCIYPGDGLQFRFFQHPTHDQETPAVDPALFGGPWQPLAMIHLPGAKQLTPRKWLVPFPVPPRQQPILPLIVEFERDIPPADQWPAARGQ